MIEKTVNADRIARIIDMIGYKSVSTNYDHRGHSTNYISESDHAWLLDNNYRFHVRKQYENGSYEYLVMAPENK